MKKALLISLITVAVIGVGLFAFREPLLEVVADRLTADMFVTADDDAFDPGVPVGARFPAIQARYDGRTVTDIAEFAGANGLVLFPVRSVDW